MEASSRFRAAGTQLLPPELSQTYSLVASVMRVLISCSSQQCSTMSCQSNTTCKVTSPGPFSNCCLQTLHVYPTHAFPSAAYCCDASVLQCKQQSTATPQSLQTAGTAWQQSRASARGAPLPAARATAAGAATAANSPARQPASGHRGCAASRSWPTLQSQSTGPQTQVSADTAAPAGMW